MQAHRIIFQILTISSRVLGRAVTEAWRQAAATKPASSTASSSHSSSSSSSGGSSSSSGSSSSALLGSKTLSLGEACQILNVKPPRDGEADMAHVMERFKRLFDANEVANGGSFYLQSKVLRARERIQREVAQREEEREMRRETEEGWRPKVWKDGGDGKK